MTALFQNGTRGLSSMRLWLASLAIAMAIVPPARAVEPVHGDIRVTTDGGFARLLFRFNEEVGAQVRMSGPILVISFSKPVDVPVDRLTSGATDYISAARRDPDGTAIRIALTRRVKFNTIPAAERFYVDLLPENWAGVMPGLPQDVVDDLARRAVELSRQSRQAIAKAEAPTIRVKVASQPTFVRYGFEIPDGVKVRPERAQGSLTLNFDHPIKLDLADAIAALPPTLQGIDAATESDNVTVKFTLTGAPTVKSFREDNYIYVDIGRDLVAPRTESSPDQPQPPAADAKMKIDAPETVPAMDAPDMPTKATSAVSAPIHEVAPIAPAVDTPPPARTAAAEPAGNGDPSAPVKVTLNRDGDNLRLGFPFAGPTPAAVFRRGEILWLVFDTPAPIDIDALKIDASRVIRDVSVERSGDGAAIVRVRLARPRLTSLEPDGPGWVVGIGDSATAPTRALTVSRSIVGKESALIAIPFAAASKVHFLVDAKMGSRLMVITALAPVRGFVKAQNFVELHALASTQGVVVQPIADDLTATLTADKISIGRPGGLALSSVNADLQPADTSNYSAATFDAQVWGFDKEAKFQERQSELLAAAAAAAPAKKRQARFNLARFYLARDMAAEAKAVLDIALGDNQGSDDVTGLVLKSVAELMLDRPEQAMKDLSAPAVGNLQDAPVWRAVALALQGKWPEAHERFKALDNAMAGMPVELQRMVMTNDLRASIEVRDFTGATKTVNDFDVVGIPPELGPSIQVLTGRLLEGMNRPDEALISYRAAAASADRRAAAQARLREIVLLFNRHDMKRDVAVHELETLTTVWRGDESESEGLKLLAHLYTEDGRYREAFHVMRTAMRAHPNSDMTRKIQDEAAVTFDSLFMAGKGDALSPIEALGLFYDYRELTPIGRRGDEMIRRLADRLVGVDLLDQAAELLQHQVDNRLQGAARAQIATRLATVYLMNHKADRALAALQNSRNADLSNDIREQRLLLEARAMSDIGRYDLALELIANFQGSQAIRLRSDIYWAAKRWRDSGEQMELLYGERWKEFTPLDDTERNDILRAAVAYSLADESLGLVRLRDKYAAKMAEGPDRRAFDVVSSPIGASNPEFKDVAKRVSNTGELDAFLRDMNERYQLSAAPIAAKEPKTGMNGTKKTALTSPAKPDAAPPAGLTKPDAAPTGSIAR